MGTTLHRVRLGGAALGDVLLALPVAPGFQIGSVVAWRGSANTITIGEGLMQTCHVGECAVLAQRFKTCTNLTSADKHC